MEQSSLLTEVQVLIDQARRNTGPRQQHIVPASYLKRWAVQDRVRVHRLGESKSHLARASQAAREGDYYRVESADVDAAVLPPNIFETILSRVEGKASGAIDQLVSMPSSLGPQERYDTATFMAFQMARGHRTRLRIRASVNELAKLQTRELSDAYIRRVLRRGGTAVRSDDVSEAKAAIEQLQRGEVVVEPQDAQAVALAFSGAQVVARHLYERSWAVCRTRPSLITTDEPVHPVGGPGWPRTELSGVGSAGIVAFPLSPERMLLAVRLDLALQLGHWSERSSIIHLDLDYPETFAVCRELLMSATRWAFERSDRNVIGRLKIPARPDDLSVEEGEAVGVEGSLVRHFNYTRWQNAEAVFPWPLEELWPVGWRCRPMPEWLLRESEAYEQDSEESVERMRKQLNLRGKTARVRR
jgi:hypothetical protein